MNNDDGFFDIMAPVVDSICESLKNEPDLWIVTKNDNGTYSSSCFTVVKKKGSNIFFVMDSYGCYESQEKTHSSQKIFSHEQFKRIEVLVEDLQRNIKLKRDLLRDKEKTEQLLKLKKKLIKKSLWSRLKDLFK